MSKQKLAEVVLPVRIEWLRMSAIMSAADTVERN
jgi:hypothetical protein